MNVFGFSDAFEHATQVDLAADLKLPVATVPLLVALKFVAYSDRKDQDGRDLSDLWHVVENYPLEGRESELVEGPLSQVVDDISIGNLPAPCCSGSTWAVPVSAPPWSGCCPSSKNLVIPMAPASIG